MKILRQYKIHWCTGFKYFFTGDTHKTQTFRNILATIQISNWNMEYNYVLYQKGNLYEKGR